MHKNGLLKKQKEGDRIEKLCYCLLSVSLHSGSISLMYFFTTPHFICYVQAVSILYKLNYDQ